MGLPVSPDTVGRAITKEGSRDMNEIASGNMNLVIMESIAVVSITALIGTIIAMVMDAVKQAQQRRKDERWTHR